ncbi:MAG: LamG domain-containing protein [Flavobacterium sp.]|nr:MAG: LamG domain-containing protein [Flavobacterium sp.]
MKKILLTIMFVSFLNSNAQNPVQEFNFNGNLNSKDNTISFVGAANFVNDRMGVAKSAQRLISKALQAVVGDLPQDNKPRSMSIWVKFNTVIAPNYVFGYGSPANGQYFGLVQQAAAGGNSDANFTGWGTANDIVASIPLQKEVWYQYCITYDGNVSKLYRNGELLKSAEGISRTTKGYIFRLGELNTTIGINADVDDLKIYNVAMTDEQVMESYTSSKPIVSQVAETAPATSAPKKAVTTTAAVKTKTTASTTASAPATTNTANTGTKIVEVFSQGVKIPGTNASNISDLPEGIYLVKITNAKK